MDQWRWRDSSWGECREASVVLLGAASRTMKMMALEVVFRKVGRKMSITYTVYGISRLRRLERDATLWTLEVAVVTVRAFPVGWCFNSAIYN